MSLGELLVIVIVGLLVLKPEDLPKVLRKIRQWRDFIDNTKKSLMSSLDVTNDFNKPEELEKDVEQINFYLTKIAALGEEYEGNYSLTSIRNHYRTLVNCQLTKPKILDKKSENIVNLAPLDAPHASSPRKRGSRKRQYNAGLPPARK